MSFVPPYVQSSGSGSSIVSPSITLGLGNLAIARLVMGSGSFIYATGVNDTAGNTWYLATGTQARNTNIYGGENMELWYAVIDHPGASVITAALSGSTGFNKGDFAQFSGVVTSSPFYSGSSASGNGANPSVGVLVNAPQLIICCFQTNAATAGTWSNMADITDPGSTYPEMGYATSSVNFTAAVTGGTSGQYIGSIASFNLLPPSFVPSTGAFLVGI